MRDRAAVAAAAAAAVAVAVAAAVAAGSERRLPAVCRPGETQEYRGSAAAVASPGLSLVAAGHLSLDVAAVVVAAFAAADVSALPLRP